MSKNSIIQQVFHALGLDSNNWTSLDTIDNGCQYILENKELFHKTLPKRVVGDLTLRSSEVALVRRKSLLAFARRLAQCLEATALVRKRTQVRENKQTVSKYSYKVIRG